MLENCAVGQDGGNIETLHLPEKNIVLHKL